jgi:hypothetical protein
MSKRNGDKARFQREQKKKMIRRKRTQEVRKALANNTAETTSPKPEGKFTGLISGQTD